MLWVMKVGYTSIILRVSKNFIQAMVSTGVQVVLSEIKQKVLYESSGLSFLGFSWVEKKKNNSY
jgi:hypothetical protein